MKSDRLFDTAAAYVKDGVPFFVFKPEKDSFDTAIPYLAQQLSYSLIKVAIHDLGPITKAADALHLVRYVLDYGVRKPTILWVEDITVVDDKAKLISDVLQSTKENENIRVVFTCIKSQCEDVVAKLPGLDWDPKYAVPAFDFTQVFPDRCFTDIIVPQDMHFRVFTNAVEAITKELLSVPKFSIETTEGKQVDFSSIINVAALAMHKGDLVRVHSNEVYGKHAILVAALLAGWQKPVDLAVVVDAKQE